MSLKVQKIRSLENAVYKDSYNRVRFQISADDMSTDMSESYLAMKLYIVNGVTGKPYTKEEILNLDKSKVMFSFGSSLGEAYSPACLIKTARIFSMINELNLLEEVNYCNVLTQTLNQFVQDFASLSSESLLTMSSTGSLMMSSIGAGCGSYFGAELSLQDQSVQVNIKLSEIFGICKTNNFHLSMTGGLQIELELEDTHSLIQQRVAVDLVAPLPETLGTSIGFTPDYSTNHKSIRTQSQNLFSNSANLLASSSALIEKPESYKYDNSYVQSVIASELVDTANLIEGQDYQIQDLNYPTLTEQNWTDMGAVASADGPDVDTAALVPGTVYTIKTLGPLNPLDWDVAGAAVNANDSVGTTTITPGAFYKIKGLGNVTLAQWNTAGWLGAALPFEGDTFECKALVAGTDGVVDTLTNPAIGDVFTALAVTTTGATVFVDGKQKVGQKFNAIAAGPAGGKCYSIENGQMKPAVGGNGDTIQFVDSIKWTTANMDQLLMTVGRQVKMFWKITQPNHVPRFFQHINTIKQRVAAAEPFGAKLVLETGYIIPNFNGTHLQNAVIEFDHFEVVSAGINLTVNTANAHWDKFQQTQTVEMTFAEVAQLQSAGLLSAGTDAQIVNGVIPKLLGTSDMVCMAVDLNVGDNTSIYPDVFDSPDIPSLRKLYSNQSVRLPAQGGLATIVEAVRLPTGKFDVTFIGLGLNNNNSLQNSAMVVPGGVGAVTPGLGVITPATSFNLRIWNAKESNQAQPGSEMVIGQSYMITDVGTSTQAQWVAAGNDNVAPGVNQTFVCVAALVGNGQVAWVQSNKLNNSYKAPTWEITKAELVLIQTEKSGMPPASIYSTVKVEAVTIENSGLDSYNRQFVVSEPNCYSALLCTPLYTNGVSLISHSRNIQQYRWSVNNIDNTNRNIVIQSNTSKYPSTLHLDKFLDVMHNDVSSVASLSGINGVARSQDPAVVFPLKIYSASDAESQYLNPLSGYSLQIALYGDNVHNKSIIQGPIFLFKYCFKTL